MRRSNKMASGLCSSARAKPCSGSPESMTSKTSLSSRRIRRRKASSSSTSNSFPIAKFLLLHGAEIAAGKFSRRFHGGRRLLPAIEHLAHLADKNFFREWLVQEVGSWFVDTMSCNKTVGISRHVQDLHSRLARQQLFRQNAAVHAGHHHVSQQKIKNACVPCCDRECFFATLRGHHTESGRFKIALG